MTETTSASDRATSAAPRARTIGRLATAVIGLGLLAGLVAAPARAEQLSDTGKASMAQVAGCAAGASTLLVSIVVDESGSLRETDPTNQRVGGINSAIDALADLRGAAGGRLEVEADLGVFAETYTPLVAWLPLDEANAAQLKSVSSTELPQRVHGATTDYRAALAAARTSLDARAAAIAGTTCKVVLWFTDGAFDVAGDPAAALGELCGPGGLVDAVRDDHISVIALALFHEPTSVTPAQREQLRAVAEGVGDGATCGTSTFAGAYLRADDASALRRVFAGVGALINQASQSTSVACPSADCAGGAVRFPVDRGTAGFQVIVDSPDDAARLTLTAPDGQVLALTTQSALAAPGGVLDVTARNGLTTATARFDGPDGVQVGEWAVTATNDAGSPSPVVVDRYYFWGASLSIEAPDGVLVGRDSRVTVTATVAGRKVSPEWYGSMELTMTTGGSPMAARMDDGVLVGSVSLPADGAPAEVVVTASASAVSTPSGIRLAPVAASATLATGIAPAPQAEAKATTVTPPGAQPPRWAFVSGLAVLALALPSAVLARRRWGSGRPPSAGGPAGGDGPGPEAPPGSPALAPAPELAPEPAPTTAPGPHRRGDVLASRGDALHELNRVSAKIPTPRGPADDPPRGASGDPVDRTAPDASWVPLADTSGPTLRAGWPFVEHGGERTDG